MKPKCSQHPEKAVFGCRECCQVGREIAKSKKKAHERGVARSRSWVDTPHGTEVRLTKCGKRTEERDKFAPVLRRTQGQCWYLKYPGLPREVMKGIYDLTTARIIFSRVQQGAALEDAMADLTPRKAMTVREAVDGYVLNLQGGLDRVRRVSRRLEQFLTFIGKQADHNIRLLKPEPIMDFFTANSHWSAHTASNHVRDLRALGRWCVLMESAKKSPFEFLKKPKTTPANKHTVTDEEFVATLERVDTDWVKDMLILMRETGLSMKDAYRAPTSRLEQTELGHSVLYIKRAKTDEFARIHTSPVAIETMNRLRPVVGKFKYGGVSKRVEEELRNAVRVAGVRRWTTSYLRNTKIRQEERKHGLALAQALAGHTNEKQTLAYILSDDEPQPLPWEHMGEAN